MMALVNTRAINPPPSLLALRGEPLPQPPSCPTLRPRYGGFIVAGLVGVLLAAAYLGAVLAWCHR